MMKCLTILATLAVCSLARPADEAPLAVLPYGLPYHPVPYYHPYAAINSGLVYPVAEAYVHDPTGDVSDDASPKAEAYVHDPTGDTSDNSSPEAEAYVHDATGDA